MKKFDKTLFNFPTNTPCFHTKPDGKGKKKKAKPGLLKFSDVVFFLSLSSLLGGGGIQFGKLYYSLEVPTSELF